MTALVYGLSLVVRFTSAAGEEMKVPTPLAQRAHLKISIMTRDSSRHPYQAWDRTFVQPIVSRHGLQPNWSSSGCIAP